MVRMNEFVFALLAVVGNGVAQTDFNVLTSNLSVWDQDDWTLTATQYVPGQYQSRMSLANGHVGASLAAAGPFFEIDVNQTDPDGSQPTNGWPLFDARLSFSTISGFYDVQPGSTGGIKTNYPWLNQYGWESFISGIPHPTALIFGFGDVALDARVSNETISNFSSTISFKDGVGSWSYHWNPSDVDAEFDVEFMVLFSRVRPNVIAVRAEISPSDDINGTITDLLDGQSALRTTFDSKGVDEGNHTIYSAVHPLGLENVTAFIVSGSQFPRSFTNLTSRSLARGSFVSTNESTIGQTYNISLEAGQSATFYKYVGVASTDRFSDAEDAARQAQAQAQSDGWQALYEEHVAAWNELMADDAVDDFTDPETGSLPEDPDIQVVQIAAIANTFYLLQNLQPDDSGLNDNSISVGGLVSDSYAGMVFWDADYWMAPGLNIAFPGWAEQISNYRVKQHQQALDNANFNGYPNGSALYSWTAGRYGNCTGTGPCVDYEYHLNYDIAFNLFQVYNVTQNRTWFDNGPRQVIDSIATMTSNLLYYNETTKSYWIRNMTDPDEYANNIDNGAFTMASAAQFLRQVNDLRLADGLEANETWAKQALNIEFPVAPSNITLEYQTMNNSVEVKQADVVLLTYPLDYKQNYELNQQLLDLDYYANKQSPDGPAMTYSVFAINANTLSPSGCSAYTYTLYGQLPYLRAPFYQFSEQANDDPLTNGNTNPAFPFLTGHGGADQIVPFGFLGLRTDQAVMGVMPSLPPQIPYVRVRQFHFAGATFTASINNTHTNITRLPTPSDRGLVDTFANESISFVLGPTVPDGPNTDYSIVINQTLTLPNRIYANNLTYMDNILQCAPVSSRTPLIAGQFPVAATDGATSTRWQPRSNTTRASLVVDLGDRASVAVRSIVFDWGSRPPVSAWVQFSNSTFADDEDELTTASASVSAMAMATAGDGDADTYLVTIPDVQISQPFDPAVTASSDVADVVPVQGNTTVVNVGGGGPGTGDVENPNTTSSSSSSGLSTQIWSGRYARLVIEGCREEDGKGATVGEWIVVGS